jgi:hypothetical protein
MGEGIGHDIALHLLLQAFVTNGRRGLQRLINVPRLEEIVLLLSTVRPNASEAIRLQLDGGAVRPVRLAPAAWRCSLQSFAPHRARALYAG